MYRAISKNRNYVAEYINGVHRVVILREDDDSVRNVFNMNNYSELRIKASIALSSNIAQCNVTCVFPQDGAAP